MSIVQLFVDGILACWIRANPMPWLIVCTLSIVVGMLGVHFAFIEPNMKYRQ